MKTLTDHEIRQIAEAPALLICLDYDGTLTPIVKNPEKGVLNASGKKLLQTLKKLPGIKIALLSGRSLGSLKKMVRIPGIVYAGNHGFELDGFKMKRVHPAALAAKSTMTRIAKKLKDNYRTLPGILIENKTYSLSIHYRRIPSSEIPSAKSILLRTLRPFLKRSKVAMTDGKKVWEIRPAAEWNKGTTLVWLFARIFAERPGHIHPIYIGDDLTDEDAFKVLKKRGTVIKVTEDPNERSHASHRLRSPGEVFRFLKKIIAYRRETRRLCEN